MGRSIIVLHEWYGCETGCCGHAIYVTDNISEFDNYDEKTYKERVFLFDHPDKEFKEWIKETIELYFGEDHSKDINYDKCIIVED